MTEKSRSRIIFLSSIFLSNEPFGGTATSTICCRLRRPKGLFRERVLAFYWDRVDFCFIHSALKRVKAHTSTGIVPATFRHHPWAGFAVCRGQDAPSANAVKYSGSWIRKNSAHTETPEFLRIRLQPTNSVLKYLTALPVGPRQRSAGSLKIRGPLIMMKGSHGGRRPLLKLGMLFLGADSANQRRRNLRPRLSGH